MLKTTSLGRYWQEDNCDRSSFTRVRCISTGSQAVAHVYGSFLKARAFSVPEVEPPNSSSKKQLLLRAKKKHSLPFGGVSGGGGGGVTLDSNSLLQQVREKVEHSYASSSNGNSKSSSEHSLEIGGLAGRENSRLLVCTLDTELNKRNLEEDGRRGRGRGRGREDSEDRSSSPSLSGSVETVTTTQQQLTSSLKACRSCGNALEYSDMVLVFDTDTYHAQCFNCGQCKCPVDPSQGFLVLEDGSPLCRDCSPTCHVCRQKIVSSHVNVLNKDFHEDCLRCSVCEKVRNVFIVGHSWSRNEVVS